MGAFGERLRVEGLTPPSDGLQSKNTLTLQAERDLRKMAGFTEVHTCVWGRVAER